jgi:D-3-phosphoglycerate dehydrogenase
MSIIIKPYNNIAQTGLDVFNDPHFLLDRGANNPTGIVLRSANLHDQKLGSNLLAVARAGAGYNNVPVEELTEQGVVVMNTPGANANAVKELVLASLLLGARHLLPAWDATRHLDKDAENLDEVVENMKKDYTGFELPTRVLGVVGLGKIGVLVANACASLGMTVFGYDPHISVANAWQLDARVQQATNLSTLLNQVDCLSIHVPLTAATRGLIGEEQLSHMRPQSLLLNFSRDGIVNTKAVCQALQSGHLHQYFCDFPEPNLLEQPNAFCFPHLGASTQEASDNCAQMACVQLRDYLLSGNLKHCVNFPDLELPTQAPARLCVFNQNVPNMVAQITQALSHEKINIRNLANRSRDDRAYNLIELDSPCSEKTLHAIAKMPGIIRVRQLRALT